MRRFGPLLVLSLAALLAPAHVDAWVQTKTCIDMQPEAPTTIPFCEGDELPIPLSWPGARVRYHVNRDGMDDFPTPDGQIAPELHEAIDESMATWHGPDCSPFQFIDEGLTDTDEFIEDDGKNVIVFHDEGEWPYASAALACTAVTFRPGEPDIVNADMEINSDAHEFVFVEQGGMDGWDVRNTVTHEAGHMLGLAHTPVNGATMEFDAAPGETEKRDLHQDDIDGLCAVYPPGSDDVPKPDPGGNGGRNGCCAVLGPSAPAPTLPWVLIALLVPAVLRRRVRQLPW